MPSQLIPLNGATRALQEAYHQEGLLPDTAAAGVAEVAFLAQMPPLGHVAFILKPVDAAGPGENATVSPMKARVAGENTADNSTVEELLTLGNGAIEVVVDPSTGAS